MIRIIRQPLPARFLYPDALFRIPGPGKRLWLTFDDGPDPETTTEILGILEKWNIRATFFCTGERVSKYPWLFARIASSGHSIGNHGYIHTDGRTTPVRKYCASVFRGREVTCSNLFRPPYGRIRMRQYKIIERSSRMIFWDVMPYDFDQRLTPEKVLSILKRNIRPGSIIVLHDNQGSRAPQMLDGFLDYALNAGYEFLTMNEIFTH